ncbi:MAG: hypothetical protein P4M15_08875 [Alphaproteobacteria bacterium]|nr:hypothetical protein [Alphaproteobacteria bacterium]
MSLDATLVPAPARHAFRSLQNWLTRREPRPESEKQKLHRIRAYNDADVPGLEKARDLPEAGYAVLKFTGELFRQSEESIIARIRHENPFLPYRETCALVDKCMKDVHNNLRVAHPHLMELREMFIIMLETPDRTTDQRGAAFAKLFPQPR